MPLQQQVPMQPPQQPSIQKRTKKPLMIVNPDTHDIVNKDYVDASSDPAAPSDPVPARESLPKVIGYSSTYSTSSHVLTLVGLMYLLYYLSSTYSTSSHVLTLVVLMYLRFRRKSNPSPLPM